MPPCGLFVFATWCRVVAEGHDTSHRGPARPGPKRLWGCKPTPLGCCPLLVAGVGCQPQGPPARHCVGRGPPSGAHYAIAPKPGLGPPVAGPATPGPGALGRQLLGHAPRHGPNVAKGPGGHGCHRGAACHSSLPQQPAVAVCSLLQQPTTTPCYNSLAQLTTACHNSLLQRPVATAWYNSLSQQPVAVVCCNSLPQQPATPHWFGCSGPCPGAPPLQGTPCNGVARGCCGAVGKIAGQQVAV